MLISVEGCVGIGKSTVAKGLAAYRRSKNILEEFDLNPFLPAFYENAAANAVETEFTFLFLHFHQLKRHAREIAESEFISDFHLGKDLLYADLNLVNSKTLSLFKELHDILQAEIAYPDLTICLSASTELVLKRIQHRKREMEMKIDTSYFEKLNSSYERFFQAYRGKKVTISMNEWDFLENSNLFGKLSALIDDELKRSSTAQ